MRPSTLITFNVMLLLLARLINRHVEVFRGFGRRKSITILLPVWSATKGRRIGGGRHEANDRSCGNGCALSGRFSSCTDQGFDCDRCVVVPV